MLDKKEGSNAWLFCHVRDVLSLSLSHQLPPSLSLTTLWDPSLLKEERGEEAIANISKWVIREMFAMFYSRFGAKYHIQ